MNFVQTIEADAQTAVAEVKANLTYLKDEGERLIAWVDRSVPAARVAMADFVKAADADAVSLVSYAGQGLNDAIAAAEPELRTLIANLIQATGLAKLEEGRAAGVFDALDVACVGAIQSILQALVSTGLASVLAKLAPAPSVAS